MQFHFSDGDPSTITLFDDMCSLISLMNEQVGSPGSAKDCVLNVLIQIVKRP